jgi:predicted secreted protein
MPQASNSVGSILKIGVVPVAKLTKIGAPEMSKSEIDVTTLDSTGGYKEFIPDFRDGGSVSIEGFAISDAGQTALKTNFDADVLTSFTLETPSGLTIMFNGYVSKFKKGDAGVGQAIGFSGELRVSGVVSFGEVASTGCSAITITADDGSTPLTAVATSPSYLIGLYKYVQTFTTETAIGIKATNATALTTMKLYVDDVYVQDLLTTVVSDSIAFPVGAKKISVLVYQTDKTPLIYEFMVARTA